MDVAGLGGGHQPGPGPVAFGSAGLGALIAAGADLFSGFGFNQFLNDHPDRFTDQMHAFSGTERVSISDRAHWDRAIGGPPSSMRAWPYTPKIPTMALYVGAAPLSVPNLTGRLPCSGASGLGVHFSSLYAE